ncbi:MAG: PKD domain-containing protein [bacterium]|nr:PKD domain-containing protein [bacterium]
MHLIRKLLIAYLIANSYGVFAQTNNFWVQNYGGFGFTFNKAGNFLIDGNLVKTNFTTGVDNCHSVADFNGSLAIYSVDDKVYNSKNLVIANGDSLKCTQMGFLNSKYTLTIDTCNYLIYGHYYDIKSRTTDFKKIYFNYVKRDRNEATGYIIPANRKNYSIAFKDTVLAKVAFRNGAGQPVMVLRTNNYFYALKFLNGGIPQLMDSFYYPQKAVIADSFLFNPKLTFNRYGAGILYSNMSVSNNGNYISFTNEYSGGVSYLNLAIMQYCGLNSMAFNKETGKFAPPQLITENLWHYKISKSDIGNTITNQVFSPNDSMLYYLNEEKSVYGTGSSNYKLMQNDFYNKKFGLVDSFNSANIGYYSDLNHLGEFFYTYGNSNLTQTIINKILTPNLVFPALILKKNISSFPFLYSFTSPRHQYDFLRTSMNIKYDCAAQVSIKNNSQYWIGFTNYTWHIQDETGKEIYYYTKEPTPLTYKKNGDYIVKLFGYSPRGSGYGEWYIDTIKIRIPPKPVANFYAKDSIVCRYTGLRFFNLSKSKDTISNKYLWSFGDGTTSSEINPTHIYTNPGLYSVSLLYRNGYCDSTLVKNQYIRVVDAPKPGFNVQYKQGCSPFIANFTDTVTLNVKQKDYYFSDLIGWQNINITTPNFTHRFEKLGVYTALQRLTGFTGCIIQTDSIIFNITKGLTTLDTLSIINSSIEQKNALLYWPKQTAAVRYQIYKDGKFYLQTTDTFLIETSPYTKDVIYSVAGIDSCGTQCSAGRVGKPIFLQGQMIGNNEASVIYFSPYQQWLGNNITYSIQKLSMGNWSAINIQANNAPYNDALFLNRSELQACYRIEAFEKSQPQIVTHSNEVCIPYIPTLFVPTAFSPNDDGINDVYDITGFGLKNYSLTVYNRWGQLVFSGADKQAWDGSKAIEGVYLIMVQYTTNAGIKLNQRVTVNLLK